VGALLGGSVLLAGCSSDGDAAATASASAMPSGAMSASAVPSIADEGSLIGADPATWAPIIVRKGESSIELVVGQVAIAPALKYAKLPYIVESSDEAVVSVSTPDAGQVVAMQAVAAGTATVTVYRGKGTANDGKGKVLATVEVTVSQQ
jgi:hypothetical protein